MSAPTKALPGQKARRAQLTQPQLDPIVLLWLFMPLELACGALTSLMGATALIPAGLLVVALVTLGTWSSWDQS